MRSQRLVGDFAAQAVVNTILTNAFPDDPIIGEEDAHDLRSNEDSATSLRNRIVQLANDALTEKLFEGEDHKWGIGEGKELSESEVLRMIDRGNFAGGQTGRTSTFSHINLNGSDEM